MVKNKSKKLKLMKKLKRFNVYSSMPAFLDHLVFKNSNNLKVSCLNLFYLSLKDKNNTSSKHQEKSVCHSSFPVEFVLFLVH
jgi:hypothetical protein